MVAPIAAMPAQKPSSAKTPAAKKVRLTRLRRFCWGFRADLREVSVADGRSRAQRFKNLSRGQLAVRRRRSRSVLPSPRMLSPVDCQDDDVISGCAKVHGVRKPTENRAPRFSSDHSKLHRAVGDAFDRFVQAC